MRAGGFTVKPLPDFLLRSLRNDPLVQSLTNSATAEEEMGLDTDKLTPTVISTIKDYQVEGVRFVLRRGGRALIADEMGKPY